MISPRGAVNITNPQSWNRYAYVLNNPLVMVDPLGLDCVYPPPDENSNSPQVMSGDCNDSIAPNGIYVDCDGCLTGVNFVQGANGDMVALDSSGNVVGSMNSNGDFLSTAIDGSLQCFGACPVTPDVSVTVNGGAMPQVPVNGGLGAGPTPSWLGTFTRNLFSRKNFIDEFKQGGCVNVFWQATADAANPFSPSLSSAGDATGIVFAASKLNAAVVYAASRPNYLGGTGLIYPMKSSVVRGMIADANAAAASGALLSIDLSLAQGFATEMSSMATGECH